MSTIPALAGIFVRRKMKKSSLGLIVLAVASLSAIIFFSSSSNRTAQSPTPTPTQSATESKTVSYQGEDGKNALELLKKDHQVETESSSFGDFVKSIDGVSPDQSHFWSFTVNGQMSEVGASAYTTKSSDQIEWRLEEIR